LYQENYSSFKIQPFIILAFIEIKKIGFLPISIGDILDILLVGILIFQLYKWLRGSLAFNIFIGLLIMYLLSFVVSTLEMNMLQKILRQFINAGFILLVIVFQPEIRRFLFYIGRGSGIGKNQFWKRLLLRNMRSSPFDEKLVDEIAKAVSNMSAAKTGALIVFADSSERQFFADTGVMLDSNISGKLIESIFNKYSPIHDGAMVIVDNQIMGAGCVLPVSENPDLPSSVGMRHRAAVGITEHIDASVIIVSEETGKISWTKRGRLRLGISYKTLVGVIQQAMKTDV